LSDRFEKAVRALLKRADIGTDGERPWDFHVHEPDFYRRVFSDGTLGLGEAYMDGWWDCEQLDELFFRGLRARLDKQLAGSLNTAWLALGANLKNLQDRRHARDVVDTHYDLGNHIYQRMLGRTMQYTCAYFRDADAQDLDQAQDDKLHLICRKLELEPGMRVLELGGGFGGLAWFMATHYGCEVEMYNISHEQVRYGREWCKDLPVQIHEKDYRDATGTFDRVVSIGLLEHVGYKNYRGLMQLARARLKDDGLALFHTIGGRRSTKRGEAWNDKYIFRHGMLPSPMQLTHAMAEIFDLEDWHNIGADYDPTLMGWERNFRTHWEEIREQDPRLDDRFYRMWRYYLLHFAGSFRARYIHLWQLVLSPKGVLGGYRSVR
jgi:cyclopropane-fatty-acyl-phospholipid synthase